MKFDTIKTRPKELLALTGYTLEEFEFLLPQFEEELRKAAITLEGKKRQHQSTTYKNSPLPTTSDRLFFILVYFKQNPTQSLQGTAFGMTQPKANIWIHFLTPVLNSTLKTMGMSPCENMEELSEQTGTVFLHDGTERPIQRPKNNEIEKKHYSGKKNSYGQKQCDGQ